MRGDIISGYTTIKEDIQDRSSRITNKEGSRFTSLYLLNPENQRPIESTKTGLIEILSYRFNIYNILNQGQLQLGSPFRNIKINIAYKRKAKKVQPINNLYLDLSSPEKIKNQKEVIQARYNYLIIRERFDHQFILKFSRIIRRSCLIKEYILLLQVRDKLIL